jgi:hypothetical protein
MGTFESLSTIPTIFCEHPPKNNGESTTLQRFNQDVIECIKVGDVMYQQPK